MNAEKLLIVANEAMEGTDMFLVDCIISPSNEITLVIDADSSVSIDACVALSRRIEETFNRDEEDFSLTVCSAGIGEELRSLRQYRKLVGHSIEVLLANGTKILATLDDVSDEGITLSYDEKVAVEGRKRKELQHTVRTLAWEEVKWSKEYLDYK